MFPKNDTVIFLLWVTREHVHVDRVACPWLIKRFVDERAQFVFLPRDKIDDFVAATGAVPFDTGTGVELDHHECEGERHCSFDAIVEKYALEDDPALERVRRLVRAADTNGLDREPRAWTLELIAVGTPLLVSSDHEALEREFLMYDAIYAYFQYEIVTEQYGDQLRALSNRGERYNFVREKIRTLPSKMIGLQHT